MRGYQKDDKIAILTEFIQSNPEARELKRALAIKMALEGEPYSKISKLVGIHKSCITTWTSKFEAKSLDGIKLGYQGSSSYLTPEQRAETITMLQTNNYWNLDELVTAPCPGFSKSQGKAQSLIWMNITG